jgi:hypothetical protein
MLHAPCMPLTSSGIQTGTRSHSTWQTAWAARRSRSYPRRHGRSGTASVSVHVRDLSQLFNSLDPSPFWDRDLDRSAAAFIEDEFSDRRSADAWHLNVTTQGDTDLAGHLQTAVESYYGRMASTVRRELIEHRRMAHLALGIGLAVFALAVTLREALVRGFMDFAPTLGEGLIVLGWIALWRPTEMLAYEWIPLVRRRRLYERLAGMRVAVLREPSSVVPQVRG